MGCNKKKGGICLACIARVGRGMPWCHCANHGRRVGHVAKHAPVASSRQGLFVSQDVVFHCHYLVALARLPVSYDLAYHILCFVSMQLHVPQVLVLCRTQGRQRGEGKAGELETLLL